MKAFLIPPPPPPPRNVRDCAGAHHHQAQSRRMGTSNSGSKPFHNGARTGPPAHPFQALEQLHAARQELTEATRLAVSVRREMGDEPADTDVLLDHLTAIRKRAASQRMPPASDAENISLMRNVMEEQRQYLLKVSNERETMARSLADLRHQLSKRNFIVDELKTQRDDFEAQRDDLLEYANSLAMKLQEALPPTALNP